MAKPTPAAADAPVLDDAVEAAGHAPAAQRFRLRLPVALKLPRFVRLPAVSTKSLALIAAGVVGVGGIAAAAYAFWPATPEWRVTPVQKPKKAKRPKAAASAASEPLTAASAASAPIPTAQA